MVPQEQSPQSKPTETNVQRIMREAKERAAQKIAASPETNIQRIMREAKERQALKNSQEPAPAPVKKTLDTAAPAGAPEGELTEVQKAERAYADADKAWGDSYTVYCKALNLDGNESYVAAYKNWYEAIRVWYSAFKESGLTEEAFNATEQSKRLHDERNRLYGERQTIGEALRKNLNNTAQGKELYDSLYKKGGLWNIRKKTKEDLEHAKDKAAAPAPAPKPAEKPQEPMTGQTPTKRETLDTEVFAGKPEGKLTEVQKAERAFKDAKKVSSENPDLAKVIARVDGRNLGPQYYQLFNLVESAANSSSTKGLSKNEIIGAIEPFKENWRWVQSYESFFDTKTGKYKGNSYWKSQREKINNSSLPEKAKEILREISYKVQERDVLANQTFLTELGMGKEIQEIIDKIRKKEIEEDLTSGVEKA